MRSGPAEFAAWDGDTLVLRVASKRDASRNAIGKVRGKRLKVSVTSAPRAGKATEQWVRLLAKEFRVSVSDVEVVFGAESANKLLRIRRAGALPERVE